ncbi:MAG: glycosyltransferase family 2 protein [Eubacteriales bacterium]|nr:glycosyltransferase family 2 protein [Eubacteriales bacterium]
MIIDIIRLVIILTGLAVIPVLFYRFPILPKCSEAKKSEFPTVSVIIPARNEEKNLPLLLRDLCKQSVAPLEIICVDDESSDATAQIAAKYCSSVVSTPGKPEGWTGKSWACHNGAAIASGRLLLFLDADVRLGRDGILRLLQAYSGHGCTISVQPYHKTERVYEQLSMLPNLIQIAANGTALRNPKDVGLYGPVILIPEEDYRRAGGHESVRKCIVEDMALGKRLRKVSLRFRNYIGDGEISFRMYSDGLKSLLQGWIKNMASGALKTPPGIFTMVFFWIASLISVPIRLIESVISGSVSRTLAYVLLYIVWVLILYITANKAGRFRLYSFVLFPALIAVYLGIFAVSFYKKAFAVKVKWKGRTVAVEDKSCK